jgi:hypothetical protein
MLSDLPQIRAQRLNLVSSTRNLSFKIVSFMCVYIIPYYVINLHKELSVSIGHLEHIYGGLTIKYEPCAFLDFMGLINSSLVTGSA